MLRRLGGRLSHLNEKRTINRMQASSRFVLLITLALGPQAAAQQSLPLPRVASEMEARMPETDGTIALRKPGGVSRFEGAVHVMSSPHLAALFDLASLPTPLAMPSGFLAQAAAADAPPAAAAASNPADFARHPRPATSRGSLPPSVTVAEAGQAIGAQMGNLVMMLRVCGWAEEEARFKGAFGLQTHERLGFAAQDAARAYDQATAMAAEMIQAFGSNPRALTLMRLQVCQPALRDTLTQSITNGNLF